MVNKENEYAAPKGAVWVCAACGKQSKDRWHNTSKEPGWAGWDESCFLNAVLCDETTIELQEGTHRVASADPFKQENVRNCNLQES